jgi:NTP pyrophosphatase (non-canonical NTP hydrolase)
MVTMNLKPIRAALEKFGANMQTDILIEEMSELTKAIIKSRRGGAGYRTHSVLEEVADVMICIESLKMVLETGLVSLGGIDQLLQEHIDEKLARLDQRVLGDAV